MLPKTMIRSLDKRRLRRLLAGLFLVLAIPTAVLIWQAYSQLKWEAFHQHRGAAEELSRRVDSSLSAMIQVADARTFADYTFLVVSGDPSANFVQRSPLSAYPALEDLPGAVGYFQVDTEGTFSTPLLPPAGTDASRLGLGETEYNDRLQLSRRLQRILADNRLVRPRSDMEVRRGIASSVFTPPATPDEDAEEADEKAYGLSRDRQAAIEEVVADGPVDRLSAQQPASETYSQEIFDQLNQPEVGARVSAGSAGMLELDDATGETSDTEQRRNRIAKVSELKLDAALQKKSEAIENEGAKEQSASGGLSQFQSRAKRRETIALAESAPAVEGESISNVSGPY